MDDYTELAKALRLCSKDEGCFKDCSYYEKCFSSNGYLNFCVMQEAADAIEQLQKSTCPHYIRNVHDSGDDSLCDKYKCEANALPRWIPVTERLPEEAGRYLVFLKASADERNRWKEYGWEGDPSYVLEALYNSRQKLWETEAFAYNAVLSEVDMENDDAVTHWMPLPTPPKEETE